MSPESVHSAHVALSMTPQPFSDNKTKKLCIETTKIVQYNSFLVFISISLLRFHSMSFLVFISFSFRFFRFIRFLFFRIEMPEGPISNLRVESAIERGQFHSNLPLFFCTMSVPQTTKQMTFCSGEEKPKKSEGPANIRCLSPRETCCSGEEGRYG